MVSRTRRLIGLVGAASGLLLVALTDVGAQPRPAATPAPALPPGLILPGQGKSPDDKMPFSDAVTLPTNRQSKGLIQAAQDYIKKKEWGTAAECLQLRFADAPERGRVVGDQLVGVPSMITVGEQAPGHRNHEPRLRGPQRSRVPQADGPLVRRVANRQGAEIRVESRGHRPRIFHGVRSCLLTFAFAGARLARQSD